MKGTRQPQDEWLEPISICLYKATKGYYRQLPKNTQWKWKLLSEAFAYHNFSQFDQSAISRYHKAKYGNTKHVYRFLLQLIIFSQSAQIRFEKKGADAADPVGHFHLSYGDFFLMDLINPQRLDDI